MRDLQRRLGIAGSPPVRAEAGLFCASTEAAVKSFQSSRGLPTTGWCDERTWLALVEANWVLGDRLLTLGVPMMRGDDVAALQARLAYLGFDPGKVDGILGPNTQRALSRFQRDYGLAGDGVCGPETVQALERVGRQSGTGPGVATVREAESLRSNIRLLNGCRIVVGQFGGLSAVVRLASRQLRSAGALVVPLDEPDPSVQAQTSNGFTADVYLGLEASPSPGAVVHYYAVPAFESLAGRALAERFAASIEARRIAGPVRVEGRRLPVLRETRMPAVLCCIGPTRTISDQAPVLATAVAEALGAWVQHSRE